MWGFPWFKIRVSRKNNKRGRSDDWFVVCYISHKEREEKVKRCFCCSLMPSCCPCEELAASFASVSPGLIWEASPLCYEIKGWDGNEIKTAADQIYSRNVKQTWSKTVRWSSESRSGFISLTSLRRHTKMIRCCFGLNMCDASVQSAKAEVGRRFICFSLHEHPILTSHSTTEETNQPDLRQDVTETQQSIPRFLRYTLQQSLIVINVALIVFYLMLRSLRVSRGKGVYIRD